MIEKKIITSRHIYKEDLGGTEIDIDYEELARGHRVAIAFVNNDCCVESGTYGWGVVFLIRGDIKIINGANMEAPNSVTSFNGELAGVLKAINYAEVCGVENLHIYYYDERTRKLATGELDLNEYSMVPYIGRCRTTLVNLIFHKIPQHKSNSHSIFAKAIAEREVTKKKRWRLSESQRERFEREYTSAAKVLENAFKVDWN